MKLANVPYLELLHHWFQEATIKQSSYISNDDTYTVFIKPFFFTANDGTYISTVLLHCDTDASTIKEAREENANQVMILRMPKATTFFVTIWSMTTVL